MSEYRDERTIKEIIEYLKIQNGNCSNELSNVEGLCLVNYIEYLEEENERLHSIIKEVREYIETLQINEYDGNSYWIGHKDSEDLSIEDTKEELLEILDKEEK